MLLQNPDVLLLDEPTKGVDNEFKESFYTALPPLPEKLDRVKVKYGLIGK